MIARSWLMLLLSLVVAVGGYLLITPSSAEASSHTETLGVLCSDARARDRFDTRCAEADAVNNLENNVLRRFVVTASWVAGIISTVMIVVGGIMYATSGGEPEPTARARSTIVYALVGLAIALVSGQLALFVLRFFS